MDKAEYRSKLEEINSYAEAGAFREAAAVADEIDWKHVRSARTLCMIGEIYEASRRYEDSARILRYAYKRSSTSKTVLYRLAELDIRNGDYDEAKRFINEFEQNSPNDTSRYILRYKLMRAEKAPLDDQIQVLREYKDHEYTERWAYELAKLYRKNGQKQKCIEECDDLILWFTEGKYVTRAMELKMQLTALTPMQQAAYDASRHQEESREAAAAAESAHDNLTGLETVEKAILASSDEEDEEAKSQNPAGDPALRRTKGSLTSFQREADPALPEEGAPAEAGGLQKKLSNSIRAVFSGLRHSEEDEDADMKIAPEREVKPTVPYDEVPVEQVSWVHEELARSAAEAGGEEKAEEAVPPAEDESETGTYTFREAPAETAAAGDPAAEASDAAADAADESASAAAVLAGAAGAASLAALAAAAVGEGGEAADREEPGQYLEQDEAADPESAGEEASLYGAAGAEAEGEKKAGSGKRGLGGFFLGGIALLKKAFTAGASDEEDEEEEDADEEEEDRGTKAVSGEEAEETGAAGTAEMGEADDSGAPAAAADGRSGEERPASPGAAGAEAPEEAKEAEAEEPMAAMPEAPEIPVSPETAEAPAMAAAPEASGAQSPADEQGAAAAEDPEELPQEAAMEVDLERLFAETGSALAGEVASGGYVMADTLEEERQQAEAEADQVRKLGASGDEAASGDGVDRNLIARETDETLGLTRELHLRDAIEQELKKRTQDGDKTPIMRPEEAARRTVAEARGLPYRQEESAPGLFREPFSSLTPEDGISDEELLKLYSSNEALRNELIASDADLQDVPEESSDLPGKQAAINGAAGAGDASLLDSIISEPEVFMYIPVEGRMLTEEEKKALSYFAGIPGIDYQITSALADIHNNSGDKTSRSGNVIITGRQGSGKTHLAESLILIVCMHLGVKAAKEARLVADTLNKKDPAGVVNKMAGGFLIIEAAGSLTDETIEKLNAAMEFRTDALVVILEDEKADMKRMLDAHPDFAAKFTSRITVPIFTNDELVTFARTYAREEGFKFDEMATLALYTMIGEKQSDEEPMTVGRVRELVDKAIERNSRKLFGKLTDKEDNRVILTEKDFNF